MLNAMPPRRGAAGRAVEDLTHRNAMMSWFGCSDKGAAQCHTTGHTPDAMLTRGGYVLERTRMFTKVLPAGGVDELLTAFDSARRAGRTRFVQAFPLGGAAANLSRTATAYVHRDSLFFSLNLAVACVQGTRPPRTRPRRRRGSTAATSRRTPTPTTSPTRTTSTRPSLTGAPPTTRRTAPARRW